MNTQAYENVFRTTLICIDSYDHKVLRGRISNSYYEDSVSFESTMEFLLNMEALLEEMNWPQSFSGKRSFKKTDEAPCPMGSTEHAKEGKLATFSLRILFRQNASWQGSVFWHDKNQGESFRSVLELLTLMDSALS